MSPVLLLFPFTDEEALSEKISNLPNFTQLVSSQVTTGAYICLILPYSISWKPEYGHQLIQLIFM